MIDLSLRLGNLPHRTTQGLLLDLETHETPSDTAKAKSLLVKKCGGRLS